MNALQTTRALVCSFVSVFMKEKGESFRPIYIIIPVMASESTCVCGIFQREKTDVTFGSTRVVFHLLQSKNMHMPFTSEVSSV